MDMYTMSDFSRVNGVYQIKAVDSVGLYVNPDKQEEERQRRKRAFRSPNSENKKKIRSEYVDIHKQETEIYAGKRIAKGESLVTPFMLWMYMTGKNGRMVNEQGNKPDDSGKMEKFMAVQEKASIDIVEQKKEVTSFHAKA